MDADIAEQESPVRQDGAKRAQIMEGARKVFLSAGFDGASMNDIVRATGVSKGTLYAYFDSKEALFEAIIREQFGQTAERLCIFREEGDLRTQLTDFGVRLIGRMAQSETVALARTIMAAAGKFPKIGRAFYEAGPLFGAGRLTARLAALDASGVLKVPDPERAAWQFVDLCQSYIYKRLLFGVVDSLSREEIEASVTAGVDVFLKAYSV